MIRLFGELFLFIALGFSLLQCIPPLIGYYRQNPYALAFARPSALGQFVFVLAAYALLTLAFVNNDFSIAYVAANSHPQLPFMYRLTAVWGAHEGSILLWILVLNIWSVAFAVTQKNNLILPLVLAILGAISFCFLCFLLLTSDPFLPALIASSGLDLNPLLQDPGFVIHPPMLYIGYVGFSAAFAITLAVLITGKFNSVEAKLIKQFALAAWCFLTLGIALGSWWAYRVLGWGGFWFWDPVENASLLPWLCGTALIHVLVLVEKRHTGQSWAALLAIICFGLSLLGTFLVRSGVLISAHTFASDPARGVFLLLLLGVVTALALAVYITRLPKLPRSALAFSITSREMMLLINSALLFLAMLIILLGTIYPLIIDALHFGVISVGAPYFNLVMLPIVMIIVITMAIAPFSLWQQPGKRLFGSWHVTPAMLLSHVGFFVLIIGIILSSFLKQESEVKLKPGTSTHLGPYQFFFIDTKGVQGENYKGIRAEFEVIKQTRHITTLYPEKRIYTVREMVMSKVDIHPSLFRDLYIALGEPLPQDYWSVRIYYKPFIRWIWFGGILMMIGGFLAIINSPQRRKSKEQQT